MTEYEARSLFDMSLGALDPPPDVLARFEELLGLTRPLIIIDQQVFMDGSLLMV